MMSIMSGFSFTPITFFLCSFLFFLSYPIITYHINHIISSYHIISYHIIHNHISYHTISYHIMSYQSYIIISYHINHISIMSYQHIIYHHIYHTIISYIVSYKVPLFKNGYPFLSWYIIILSIQCFNKEDKSIAHIWFTLHICSFHTYFTFTLFIF
jgi:hypothetical protein